MMSYTFKVMNPLNFFLATRDSVIRLNAYEDLKYMHCQWQDSVSLRNVNRMALCKKIEPSVESGPLMVLYS